MTALTSVGLGAAPDDGNGDTLRVGGQAINANFSELESRTLGYRSHASSPEDSVYVDEDGNVVISTATNTGTGHVFIDDLGGELYGLHLDIDAMGDVAAEYGLYVNSTIADFAPSQNTIHYGQRIIVDATAATTPTDANGDRHYTYGIHIGMEAGADYASIGGLFQTDVNGSDVSQSGGSARGVYALARSYWDDATGAGPTLYAGEFTTVATHTAGSTTARGVSAEVQQDGSGGTLSSASAVYAEIDHNAGTMTTGYQFRGVSSGSPGTSYGIHSTGANEHILEGESASANVLTTDANSAAYTGDVLRVQTTTVAGTGFDLITAFANGTSDAKFRARGDGEVTADGSFTGGGADYAEMFEWADGNPTGKKWAGAPVVLVGDKIRLALPTDNASDIIGAVSVAPVVLGDAHDLHWAGKYETDEAGKRKTEQYAVASWVEEVDEVEEEIVKTGNMVDIKKPAMDKNGEPILDAKGKPTYRLTRVPEEIVQEKVRKRKVRHSAMADAPGVTIPAGAEITTVDANGRPLMRDVVSPNYDPTKPYKPRRERKEWAAVGLVGKLAVAKGAPVGDRWLKLKDANALFDLWLVR